ANVASRCLPQVTNREERYFYLGKLKDAQYFFHWELPGVAQDIVLLQNRDDTCLRMKPEWF
ncbi:MAG: acyl-CoA dehydrogenase C-terminal domain-containing protein, partial [Gammaproteobacteria bacterium]|nr:acyl-CoA dehydrogenase C-terminal domain-containing protein [Gammaproteobacteria bacterium]